MSGRNLWLLFCALFIFVRWSFPRKVPCQSSKFGLADPRGEETCLCLSVQRGSEAGGGSSEELISQVSGQLPGPLRLFPQAHQRKLGSQAKPWKVLLKMSYPSVYQGALAWLRGALSCLSAPLEHRQKSQALQGLVEGPEGPG